MNFFKKKQQIVEDKRKDFGIEIDMSSWFEVFSASLGSVMANQERCSKDVVKGRAWHVDLQAGTIAFGNDVYPVQFLGSESHTANTWLWGWDNINHFPDHVVSLANEMKQFGEQVGLETFTRNSFALRDNLNGHTIAMVVCALSKNNLCYYRGPYDGGAALFTFTGFSSSVFNTIDYSDFIRISLACIQQFQVDHKLFIESFLYQNKIHYEWKTLRIHAFFSKTVYIEFEEVEQFLRIKEIKT